MRIRKRYMECCGLTQLWIRFEFIYGILIFLGIRFLRSQMPLEDTEISQRSITYNFSEKYPER